MSQGEARNRDVAFLPSKSSWGKHEDAMFQSGFIDTLERDFQAVGNVTLELLRKVTNSFDS